MRVLGVDPGLTRCGVGVVDSGAGRSVSLVDVGVIRTGSDWDISRRLVVISQALKTWIDQHGPDVVSVEQVFAQHNASTVMGTAQASGVAILVAAEAGLPVSIHTPTEVKAAVTGHGRADKDQVATMVMRILAMTERPQPADAADALALAICHLWRGGLAATSAGAGPAGEATPAQRAWRNAAAGRPRTSWQAGRQRAR